jgi:hypothetical protein
MVQTCYRLYHTGVMQIPDIMKKGDPQEAARMAGRLGLMLEELEQRLLEAGIVGQKLLEAAVAVGGCLNLTASKSSACQSVMKPTLRIQ